MCSYGTEGVLLQDGWDERCALTGALKKRLFGKGVLLQEQRCALTGASKKGFQEGSPCIGDERWVYTGKPKSQRSEKVG